MQKRTRKGFNGTMPTGKKIGDLLPEILQKIVKKEGPSHEAVFAFWYSLIGVKMGKLTQPISLKNRVLTIKVKSATLYALLCQYEKPRLLEAIQAKFQVEDLVFRIG